jgi:hypothetical protein
VIRGGAAATTGCLWTSCLLALVEGLHIDIAGRERHHATAVAPLKGGRTDGKEQEVSVAQEHLRGGRTAGLDAPSAWAGL